MNKIQKFLLATLVILGGSALAIQRLELNISPYLSAFSSGILVGPASARATDTLINQNKITKSLANSATINFAIQATFGCEESSAITVTGAALGDACAVGAPVLAGADAGVLSGEFSCFVSAASAVKVRFCGIDNPASAAFEVRVTSNN